ncbi:tRNA adenosine(34) deaminase TadA [Ferrimonas balearica]|uniref:tRNA adenosine(34) deaminase TadA n=1 Tax=Ferrimonas balearica TaxID=44012 RepID=UPI001C99904B|nr:tRNA adenosine(34) deaminase TadA [Ferrimonas balearica]MBY5922037.1 tRNA adenosine(34) deaminase TadA [Ferrimonas balearica]MBY5994623.1 tRNA adenosine(34) deaminase TadA [Ferrimonas balearica]
MEQHQKWMAYAMSLAEKAEALGEVPVGAVLVRDGEVLAEGFNQSITLNDPSAHAEMLCMRAAGEVVGNYRLLDTTLYVTLEPCPMCAGAMVHARIGTLVYGASDPKTGAAGSVMDLVRHDALNHQLEVVAGVLSEPCANQLSAFFKRRRAEKKALKQAQRAELDSSDSA